MGNLYVFDTSALISNPNVVRKSRRHGVIIPSAVLRQLDGLKNSGDGNTAYWARKASQAIEKQQTKGNLLILSEYVSISNLPNRADNQIVGTALWIRKHYDQYCDRKPKNTILVSTDRNMRIVAQNCGLKVEGEKINKTVVLNIFNVCKYTVLAGLFVILLAGFFELYGSYLVPYIRFLNGYELFDWSGWVRLIEISFAYALIFALIIGFIIMFCCDRLWGNGREISFGDDSFDTVTNPAFRHMKGNIWHRN